MHDVINMEKGLLLLCTRRFDSSCEGVGHSPIVIKSPTGLSRKIICILTGPAFTGWWVSHHINTSFSSYPGVSLVPGAHSQSWEGYAILSALSLSLQLRPLLSSCCPHHSGAWGRKLEKFHLPGFCDRLIGSFTFSRTQILPTELFVIFIMICDMFNRVLGITEIMHFNKCPSSFRDWFKRTYKLPASFVTKRTVFSTNKHCFWNKKEFFY